MEIVNLFTIEEVIETIKEFNLTIEKMQEDNLLPTSEEVLNNMPNIYDYYVTNLCMDGQKL